MDCCDVELRKAIRDRKSAMGLSKTKKMEVDKEKTIHLKVEAKELRILSPKRKYPK